MKRTILIGLAAVAPLSIYFIVKR